MACEGLGAPNTELPATMQLAPASAAASIVEGDRPPSTWEGEAGGGEEGEGQKGGLLRGSERGRSAG